MLHVNFADLVRYKYIIHVALWSGESSDEAMTQLTAHQDVALDGTPDGPWTWITSMRSTTTHLRYYTSGGQEAMRVDSVEDLKTPRVGQVELIRAIGRATERDQVVEFVDDAVTVTRYVDGTMYQAILAGDNDELAYKITRVSDTFAGII